MSGADQLKIGRVRDLFETAALTLLTLQRLFVTAQDILKIELLFMTQPAEFPQHILFPQQNFAKPACNTCVPTF